MLEENNVIRGFFEHAEYLAVKNEPQEYLGPIMDIGYTYGSRKHSSSAGVTDGGKMGANDEEK